MTPGRLSHRSEFTPVTSHCSTFAYRCLAGVSHPCCCTGATILLRYDISQRHHVNAKRALVSVWNRSIGRLERVAHAWCLRFWITRVFYHDQREVYLQITRYEMTQSSWKRDTKSERHPGMKLAPLRVFSCKHPLTDKAYEKENSLKNM